jgi:hypothetical protein
MVYTPLLKVGAPRAALAAHPRLADQPEQQPARKEHANCIRGMMTDDARKILPEDLRHRMDNRKIRDPRAL